MTDSTLIKKFCRLSLRQKLVCLEAAGILLAARAALAYLPFRIIERYMNRKTHASELTGKARDMALQEVRETILRVADHLPGKTVCFPRGIAALSMLRHRKVGVTLYYGAMHSTKGLQSHVWVKDREICVIGCREAIGYKVVAAYPKIR